LKNIRIYILSVIASALIYCCRDEVCTQILISKVNIHFYTSSLQAKSIDRFIAYGLDRSDSLLYDTIKFITPISFPLDQNNDVSNFILNFNIIIDTIYVPDSTLVDSIITLPTPDTLHFYRHIEKPIPIEATFIDTLNIEYSRRIKLISPECGFVTIFDLKDIHLTHNIVDSSLISMPLININSNEENIKIFF
jgi:hypothetical protein